MTCSVVIVEKIGTLQREASVLKSDRCSSATLKDRKLSFGSIDQILSSRAIGKSTSRWAWNGLGPIRIDLKRGKQPLQHIQRP